MDAHVFPSTDPPLIHPEGGLNDAERVLLYQFWFSVIFWGIPVVLLMVVDVVSTVFSMNNCAEKDGLEGSPTADSVEDVGRELV